MKSTPSAVSHTDISYLYPLLGGSRSNFDAYGLHSC